MPINLYGAAVRRVFLLLICYFLITGSGPVIAQSGALHPDFKITRHKLGANTLDIPDRFYAGYVGAYDKPEKIELNMGWLKGDILPISARPYGIFIDAFVSLTDQEDPRGELFLKAPHKLSELEKKDFGKMKYVGTRSSGNYDLFYLALTDSYIGCLRIDAPAGVSLGPPGSAGSYFSCDTVFRYRGGIFAWVKAIYIKPSDVANVLISVHDELSTFIH